MFLPDFVKTTDIEAISYLDKKPKTNIPIGLINISRYLARVSAINGSMGGCINT